LSLRLSLCLRLSPSGCFLFLSPTLLCLALLSLALLRLTLLRFTLLLESVLLLEHANERLLGCWRLNWSLRWRRRPQRCLLLLPRCSARRLLHLMLLLLLVQVLQVVRRLWGVLGWALSWNSVTRRRRRLLPLRGLGKSSRHRINSRVLRQPHLLLMLRRGAA
jgi:hypothetical protein